MNHTTGEGVNTTTIILTTLEAEHFLEFQKNYANILILINSGALNIKNGRAVLNFDSFGILQEISIDIKAWKRTKEIIKGI